MIVDNFFNIEECSYILSHANEFTQSGVYLNGTVEHNDYRISEHSLITDETLKLFLLKKLGQFDIVGFPPRLICIKYTKGSKFGLHRDRHNDSSAENSFFPERYKTLIIQLSDESEYEGGELIVSKKVMPKTIGSLIIFDSNKLHEVTELTEGVRYSLCIFLTKDNFKKSFL